MPQIFRLYKEAEPTTLVAWFILLFTFFPFLLLCIFNVPLGDDLLYADAFRDNGMIQTQITWFKEWSGRYMATFLISTLNPASYGYLNLAFLHPLALLIGTALSLKFLINTIADVVKFEISKILLLSIFLFFYLNFLPDIGETFYWMAGAYTYQVPVIFLFLYIAFVIKLLTSSSVGRNLLFMILAMLSLFVILGSNEVIVVYVCLLNTIITCCLFLKNKKHLLKFLPLFLVTIILSYLMIFADGNFARAELFEKPSFHLLKSAGQALSRGIFVLIFWIPTLMLLLIFIPGITKINIAVDSPLPVNIRRSSVVLIFGLILIMVAFIGFFPSIYTTRWIPQRAYTPIFLAFSITFMVIFILSVKYFPILSRLNETFANSSGILLCLLIIALSSNSNVMNAYVDITSGKASSYHKQVLTTYEELMRSERDTVFVSEIAKRPLILPIRWPERHNYLANTIWEGYFEVDNVELK